jgi:hypothetical protein
VTADDRVTLEQRRGICERSRITPPVESKKHFIEVGSTTQQIDNRKFPEPCKHIGVVADNCELEDITPTFDAIDSDKYMELRFREVASASSHREGYPSHSAATQIVNGLNRYQFAIANNSNSVCGVLYFVEGMRRKENCSTGSRMLTHKAMELILHERIKSGRWFIQNDQLWRMLKRLHEPNLLSVPLRELLHRPIKLHTKPLDKFLASDRRCVGPK